MAVRTVRRSPTARTPQIRTSADAEKDTSTLVRGTDFSLEGTRDLYQELVSKIIWKIYKIVNSEQKCE